MKCKIGDVGENFVCLYLDGENDSEKAFLETLMHSTLTDTTLMRNGMDAWTLAFKPPDAMIKARKTEEIKPCSNTGCGAYSYEPEYPHKCESYMPEEMLVCDIYKA
ncbi:MAG: hypothetical protein GY861_12725 [bacterium]|nr:hypothetical protein [bacterium]